MRARSQALATAGSGGGPKPFAWHDADALRELFAPWGFTVELKEEELSFTAASPGEFLDAEMLDHPAWIAARRMLEPRGGLSALRDETLAIFARANENPSAFRVTSRYVVALARRSP